jgi:hypothetical protein
LKNFHVVELNHFSSMLWINCICRHQLKTFTIMDKCFRATRPFLFLNWFFPYLYGDVTIKGEGLQNFGLCLAFGVFKQRGIFIVPHLLWRGLSFSGLIRRMATTFSHLLRHTRRCGWPF